MNPVETINLAFTAILRNRMRSFLTILGIVIGVTSVILLISVVSGLQKFITEQISSLGPNVMYVIPGKVGGGRGPGGSQINRLTLQDSINLKSKLAGVAEVSASVNKINKVKYQNKNLSDTTIVGVEVEYIKIIKSLQIDEGRYFTTSEADSGKRVAIIGPTIKTKLLGESSDPLGKQIQIGNLKYMVVGVMKPRGSAFGIDQDNFAAIPLIAAQKQFGDNKVQTILVSANDTDKVKEIQQKTIDILKMRISEDDFSVQTQEQTLGTISQITGVLTVALGGIAAISLIVGGIGVMNIMLVSVTERTREIGLRKALGAKPRDIRNQFLIEALTLSGLGGIIGILLGFLFSLIIGMFITTTIPLWSVVLSFGFSMAVGVIFGVAPAIRAAKLDPITALRYE